MKQKERLLILLLIGVSFCMKGKGQSAGEFPPSVTPSYALKTNLVSWATGTFNLAGEVTLSSRYSLNMAVGYNPWTFSDNMKWKNIHVMPELRFWPCEAFTGHFFGVHGVYMHYNAGNVKVPFDSLKDLETERWQGDAVGGGLSYGYTWYLSPRWSIEASIGGGYLYLSHDRYECKECGASLGKEKKHYIGPTKLGLSLIYIIK